MPIASSRCEISAQIIRKDEDDVANSIFYGDKLLTAANPEAGQDRELLKKLGLETLEPNPSMEAPPTDGSLPASPACCTIAGCC